MAEESKPLDEKQLREEITRDLSISLRIEYESRFDMWKERELAELRDKQTEQIEELVKKYYDKIQEEMKPLTQEQINTLLNQEYATFPVKITTRDKKVKEFTLVELPAAAEQKFYDQFRKRILERIKEAAAIDQATMDLPADKRIQSFLDSFTDAFDILADATAICLNWEGADEEVNPEWCKKHIASSRMWNIIQAQIHVNRLRDFFSQVLSQGVKMRSMTGRPSVQQLQELLVK
jgi:gas vesicle protein